MPGVRLDDEKTIATAPHRPRNPDRDSAAFVFFGTTPNSRPRSPSDDNNPAIRSDERR
jgi:hypothetical protein